MNLKQTGPDMVTNALLSRANQLLETAQAFYEHGQINNADLTLQRVLQMTPRNFSALYLRGIVLFQLNQVDEAYKHLKKAYRLNSKNTSTIFNLGVVCQTLSRFEESLEWYDLALSITPMDAKIWNNKGRVLKELQMTDDAIFCYEQAVKLNPQNAFAYNNISVIQLAKGHLEEALSSAEKALQLTPASPDAYNNKAAALINLKRYPEGIQALNQAVTLRPDFVEAWVNLAIALMKRYAYDDALICLEKALQIKPNLPEALYNSAIVFMEKHDFQTAILFLQRLLTLKPNSQDVLFRLGYAYWYAGQTEKMPALFEKAVTLEPGVETYYAKGCLQLQMGLFEEAIGTFNQVLAIDPDHISSHWNLGISYLTLGRMHEGWLKYEWRWLNPNLVIDKINLTQPAWTGREDLSGKTLLIHCEQGLGDTIQFTRYVLAVRPLAEKVVLVVQKPLRALMERQYKDFTLVTKGETLPNHDYQIMIMSLPLAIDESHRTLNIPTCYLQADHFARTQWQILLKQFTKKRIGLVWSGNANHGNDYNRSMPLNIIGHIVTQFSETAQFFCLQKEVRPSDQQKLGQFDGITFLNKLITDFTDTAAIAEQMDLIITVDTSVAHLAGAMGKPTWVMLPYVADWRWRNQGNRSDMYNDTRLFRQNKSCQWESIVRELMQALGEFLTVEAVA